MSEDFEIKNVRRFPKKLLKVAEFGLVNFDLSELSPKGQKESG